LALRALTADATIGLLLPCNVTVESDHQEGAWIRIANPEVMMGVGKISDSHEIKQVAKEAHHIGARRQFIDRMKRLINTVFLTSEGCLAIFETPSPSLKRM